MNGGEVEIYGSVRFFTFTGEHLTGTPLEIEPRQAEFEALIENLDEKLAAGKKKPKAEPAARAKKADLSDATVEKRLRRNPKYGRILDGDYSDYDGDHSTCDLVIAGATAREVGPDPERIDGFIRSTVLMRDKWDHRHRADGASYGQMVIEKALEDSQAAGQEGEPEGDPAGARRRAAILPHAEGEGFAVVPMMDHNELMAIMGKAYSRWLRQQFWLAEGKAPSATSIRDALLTLEARANFEGIERDVGVRVMADGDTAYLDLGDELWRAVKITPAGWEVVPSPLLFRRSRAMLPLPEPVSGGSLTELRPFLNLVGRGRLHPRLRLAGGRPAPPGTVPGAHPHGRAGQRQERQHALPAGARRPRPRRR